MLLILWLLQIISCQTNLQPPNNPNDPSKLDWLIPRNSIINRGITKDSLPPINNPNFINSSQVTLNDNDLVIGVNILGIFKVYPENIMAYHDVVNDVIKNKKIAVSYCPYTGTSMVWETTNLQGISPAFSATNYLYNSNDILYDSISQSYFQQMLSKYVAGSLSGYTLNNFGIVETTWSTWKYMFPGTQVMSPATGFSYNYKLDPYAAYKKSDSIYFYTTPIDKRLALKEKVLGLVVGGHAKIYRMSSFADTVSVIQDNFQGLSVVLAGSQKLNFIVCYESKIPNGPELTFTPHSHEASNIIMIDNEGNKWDIFGNAVDGPRRGQHLTATNSMMGYWFAFGAMFPDPLIYAP